MKTITTIKGLKKCIEEDKRTTVILQLNREVIDFLRKIHGKNRDMSGTNVQSWISCIRNGEWVVDNCEMKVNSSLTWLIDGHHRVAAVDEEQAYGLSCKMIVIPDEYADDVFRNQDTRGMKRKVSIQATLCGVKNATVWAAVEKAHRMYFNADYTLSTVDSIENYIKEHADTISRIDCRRGLNGEKAFIPSLAIACLILAAEKYPSKVGVINEFWNRVITGEMLIRSMPEYHLRSRYINRVGISQKDMVWYTLKALSFALEGMKIGVLKIVESDRKTIAKRFGISSNSNRNPNMKSTFASAKHAINK